MVAHVAYERVSRGQRRPRPQWLGWTPKWTPTTTKFCMMIKLHVRKIFTWSTMNADVRSVCGS